MYQWSPVDEHTQQPFQRETEINTKPEIRVQKKKIFLGYIS